MNGKIHLQTWWLAIAANMLLLSSAMAEKPVNLSLVGTASLGYSNFDFPEKLDHELTFPVYQVGGAAAYKKFYAAINLADSISDADVSEEEDLGNGSRYDRDISFGYQVNANWGIYAGYKSGNTSIDYTTRDDLDSGGIADTRTESYKQKGPFFGVSYAVNLARAGKINLNLAYADLNATNRFVRDVETDGEDDEFEFDDFTGTIRGKSNGFSYGIRWSVPVSGNLLFFASYKINAYKQDLTVEGNRFDNVNETISYFTTGVVFVY